MLLVVYIANNNIMQLTFIHSTALCGVSRDTSGAVAAAVTRQMRNNNATTCHSTALGHMRLLAMMMLLGGSRATIIIRQCHAQVNLFMDTGDNTRLR